MSSWKLVEAEAIQQIVPKEEGRIQRGQQVYGSNNNNNYNHRYNKGGGNNRGNYNNGGERRYNSGRNGNNRRYNNDVGGQNTIFIPDTPETRLFNANVAVQQIEFLFTDDMLCSSTFVRSYLDEEGYIPVAFFLNFPEIMYTGAFYEDIFEQIKKSEKLEVDIENETIRVKDWKKWLLPNGEGGFGVPKYIKQPYDAASASALDQGATPQGTTVSGGQFERQNLEAGELSANAREFVFQPKTK